MAKIKTPIGETQIQRYKAGACKDYHAQVVFEEAEGVLPSVFAFEAIVRGALQRNQVTPLRVQEAVNLVIRQQAGVIREKGLRLCRVTVEERQPVWVWKRPSEEESS